MTKTDTVAWRNNANSADLALGINSSDKLTFNGAVVVTSSEIPKGLTTTVTVPCGTLTFTNGILTSKGTCP
jgi:hypothetical protein